MLKNIKYKVHVEHEIESNLDQSLTLVMVSIGFYLQKIDTNTSFLEVKIRMPFVFNDDKIFSDLKIR